MYSIDETYKNIEAEFKPPQQVGPGREGNRAGRA